MSHQQVEFRNMVVRQLGLQPYEDVWRHMQEFTTQRTETTPDQFWTLEHPRVFTLGLSRQPSIILGNEEIPVVKTDRGGQITYHGPGQIVGYFLWDIRRLRLDVHRFVELVEQCMIDTLNTWGIDAERWEGNPGVYVDGKKIGSLGLRVRKGCSYHGLSLNVDMDKSPFAMINPCGIKDLEVTQLADFVPSVNIKDVESELVRQTRIHHGRLLQNDTSEVTKSSLA